MLYIIIAFLVGAVFSDYYSHSIFHFWKGPSLKIKILETERVLVV